MPGDHAQRRAEGDHAQGGGRRAAGGGGRCCVAGAQPWANSAPVGTSGPPVGWPVIVRTSGKWQATA